ncbi:unnamed protein product [Pleuronectes platessa]|uniref:Uncharacterized protein n=1 Tax=Pleuronectes platessa TaxID=8262 RepID=A0A9N7V7Q3_PLEPL|nr:unnamed protein product [Pleuronectes platessa]
MFYESAHTQGDTPRDRPAEELCQVTVSGGWFRSASEVLSTEKKSSENIEMFPSTVLFRVLPAVLPPHIGTRPQGFWGPGGTSWVQKSLRGTGHSVRTRDTDESGGYVF